MLVCAECRWQNPKAAVFCVECGGGLLRAAVEDKAQAQPVSAGPQPIPSLRAPEGQPEDVSGATILDLKIDQKILREFARLRAESSGGPTTLDENPMRGLSEPPLEGAPTLDEIPAHQESLEFAPTLPPGVPDPSGLLGPPPSGSLLGPPSAQGEAPPLGPEDPTPMPSSFIAPPTPGVGAPPYSGDDDDDEYVDCSVDFSLNGDDLEEVEDAYGSPPPLPEITYLLRPLSTHLHALLNVEDPLVLGRKDTQGNGLPEGDPFVAPQHARLERNERGLKLTDLESPTGAWLRLRPDQLLPPNALIRVGKQVLRLERCPLPEAREGLGMGASSRGDTFRLVQLDEHARPRDVHHIEPQGSRVGRRLGEMIFPSDPLMSPTHAIFIPKGDKVLVRDLESQNGTWVQVRGEAILNQGDVFLIGRSAWRVGQAD